MQKANLGKPIVWPLLPTPEEEARRKADEDAWATLELETREIKSTCAKEIEAATVAYNLTVLEAMRLKQKTVDEAYVKRQSSIDRANQKFREKTLPSVVEPPKREPVIVGIADPADESNS